jgi:hypothetical protein
MTPSQTSDCNRDGRASFAAPPWFGIRILESAASVERIQWRFPHSKKRRIRAKWTKRECNVRYEPRAFRYGENTIICHPVIAARLRAELPNAAGERLPDKNA